MSWSYSGSPVPSRPDAVGEQICALSGDFAVDPGGGAGDQDEEIGDEVLEAVDELEVALEVVAGEARGGAGRVVRGEVGERTDLAAEEAAAERAVSDEGQRGRRAR